MYKVCCFNLEESHYNLSKIKLSFRKAAFYSEKKLVAFWWMCMADNQVRSNIIDFPYFQ